MRPEIEVALLSILPNQRRRNLVADLLGHWRAMREVWRPAGDPEPAAVAREADPRAVGRRSVAALAPRTPRRREDVIDGDARPRLRHHGELVAGALEPRRPALLTRRAARLGTAEVDRGRAVAVVAVKVQPREEGVLAGLGRRPPVCESTSASPRNGHRHAVEQASRRWRGGHDVAVGGEAPRNLICALPPTPAVARPRREARARAPHRGRGPSRR